MASSTLSSSSAAAASAVDAGSTLPSSDNPPQTLVGPPQTPLTMIRPILILVLVLSLFSSM
ncbi:hypothetical protein A2U01_0098266 [Trifolium medium]|nr:hypothetical protein [Trifolium medium]